jgi:hypothetical protein
MKKTYIIVLIAGLFVFSQSVFIDDIFANVSGTKNVITNFDYLTSRMWQLKQIEVDGYYYSDSVTTDLRFQFLPEGNLVINGDTNLVPWEFQDSTQQEIVLSEGTTEEQIFNIRHLNYGYFIYDVDYHVVDATHNMDTTYNYVYKFIEDGLVLYEE